MERDRLLSIGTNGDDRDRHTDLTLDEGDVILEFLREVRGRGELSGIALPSLELGVDRAYRICELVGEVASLLSGDLVVSADADRSEAVKYVALHHDQTAHSIEHHRIAQSNEVKPAAATAAACYGAELMTERAELFAYLIEELCREGTSSDTCTISLEDPVDLPDLSWSDTQPCAASCADSIARGNEGVGAKIDI